MMEDPVAAAVDAEVREYVRLRDEHAEAAAEEKEAKARLEEQKQRLWEFLENSGVKTVSHELGRVTRIATIKASVSDKEAAARSLEELGLLEAFSYRELRRAALNEFVKERVEDGEELPDGLDAWIERQLRFTRAK
jgi:hypothetical protein